MIADFTDVTLVSEDTYQGDEDGDDREDDEIQQM